MGISTDSHHTHLSWTRHDRKDGGVGKLEIPLVADISKQISKDYGVLVDNADDEMYGVALRGFSSLTHKVLSDLFRLTMTLWEIVEETIRILKAFQYADSHQGGMPSIRHLDRYVKKFIWFEEYFKSHNC